MEYRRMKNTIIVRIDKGEEILEKVKELALAENIKLASVQAIGAIGDFTVACFEDRRKAVQIEVFSGGF